MSSPKQIAANRRNARLSMGPQTREGKKRSAGNSRKHGLSTPLELTFEAVHVPEIAALLQVQGYTPEQSLAFAKCIVDFERNEQHQRDLMQLESDGWLPKLDPASAAAENRQVIQIIDWQHKQHGLGLLGHLPPMLPQLRKLESQIAKRQTHAAARRLDLGDRHYRRAANQLLKSLRRLVT